jgi:FlaA1/EpsC-like NDP-sugar epimerase
MAKVQTKLYIVGAGFAGQMIARELAKKKIFGKVAAFIDDDKSLIGTKIDSVSVIGPIDTLPSFLSVTAIDEAVIAIPSASVERIRQIHAVLVNCGFLRIKILPSISQVIDGKAHLVQARDINPLDILGRTPVIIPLHESLSYLKGKRVLITGAGGSIGSELARQLLSGGAERLYLFGHGENSIVNIYRELHVLQQEGVGQKASVVPIIGDMRDKEYVRYIISHTHADVIFHCAAYKHVPMMEENPVAAIENNVFGTKNLLDASIEFGVERFVLISTDKAVAPVSVYGVSKMLCEQMVMQAALSTGEEQRFMFVRFGNVLGSRGSPLPIFMEQIQNGGPVTVTSKDMVRFFMTIPEACSLVLQTGGVGKNAQAYLLDMGEPIKILDLAEQVIRFSGLEPYKDVEISFIGARRGERNYEPLWLEEEHPSPTQYPKLLTLTTIPPKTYNLDSLVEQLKPMCMYDEKNPSLFRNRDALVALLRKAVPTLDEFYEQEERPDMASSVKVVL